MKTTRLFSTVIILTLLTAYNCSSKEMASASTSKDAETMETTEAMEPDVLEGNNNMNINQPRIPRFGATPEDSIQCIRNISLYQEYYSQGNRQLAFEPWREVFLNCPQASPNTFIRGVVLIKMKYAAETDPLRRDAWVDTLMMLYDQRIVYFGHTPQSREGLVLGRKAVDLFQLRQNNIMDIYQITKRSIELEGNASQADVILIYFQSLVRMVEAGLLTTDEILLAYDQVMEIIDHNLINNPADNHLFEPAKTNIDLMFEPFASCENIVKLFTPRYKNTPENIELLEKITSMLNKSGCNDSELFYKATLSLHRLKPTAQSAFLMGRMENSAQNYREAISFFEQAVSLYTSNSDKFTALMLMADITFRQLRQFSQARAYALKAAEVAPDNGRPYILIGEMYAASASQCGDNDLTKTVAYWAAVDKFNQARNIDQEDLVKERATQLINTYSQYFPSREVTFFYGLTDGDSYTVGCWINETTRVRSR